MLVQTIEPLKLKISKRGNGGKNQERVEVRNGQSGSVNDNM